MGICAHIYQGTGNPDLCDLENPAPPNKRLDRDSTENMSQTVGRLQDKNHEQESRPRTTSLSSLSAIFISRVDLVPRFEPDDKKIVLRSLPPKPTRRKTCPNLRVILPDKLETRQHSTKSIKEYTRTINRSLAKFTIL